MASTVAAALAQGNEKLQDSGSPTARLDAEVLLAHTLGRRRVDLYTHPERPLTMTEEAAYQDSLARRSRREPVSYIVRRKAFYGLTFVVDQRVLVPRPETEVLVARALAWARAQDRAGLQIADIGTGSGCIAVALATQLPHAQLLATDISAAALQVAAENVRRYGVADQIQLLQGDLCAPLTTKVDLLVANPPYTVWETLPEGITAYEPRLALDGGDDGLVIYRRLLPQLATHLQVGAVALLEIGDGQEEAIVALIRATLPGVPVQVWPDETGWARVVEIGPYGE
jgi:release factor glutamine methyltransferase